MIEESSNEELEKRRKEMEKKIDAELQRVNLKEKQCKGGKIGWIGEREAAMAVTHLLMNADDMDFRDANKLAWQFVKGKRCEPCDLLNEEKTEEQEVE